MNKKVLFGLVLAGLTAIVLNYTTDLQAEAVSTAAITVLCASWWVLEPIPIAATSLIPFAAFPLLGVTSHKVVAGSYGHSLILLLMGGFILSKAVETVGAHRRIAYGMVAMTGGGSRNLVLGFMLASALCSMWISNTATTLMLLPVAIAVMQHSDDDKLPIPLLWGIAYAASIGGVGTPIGTPPNVYFMGFYSDRTGVEYGFLDWMKIGIPIVIIMLPLSWLYLTRHLRGGKSSDTTLVLPKLGPWTSAEVRVLTIFACTAMAWIFRTEPFGGWTGLVGITTIGDSTIALTAVVALFLIPDKEHKPLMTWKDAESIPWGLLILFGGGIAIAGAFQSSGLAEAVGDLLAGVVDAPLFWVTAVICVAVTFMTEVVSNTATTTLLMPLLYAAAIAVGLEPEKLLIPAALSASCAFMLPVATAPNAIVFGTGKIAPTTMIREGIVLNLIGIVVITLGTWFLP